MHVDTLHDEQITDFFINDPKLCYMGLPDADLTSLYYHHKYIPSEYSEYFGVFDDDSLELLCIVKCEKFTEETVNVHGYVSSKFQHQGNTGKMKDTFIEYLKENTDMKKLLVMVPEPCAHVKGPALHYGLTLEGRLTNAMTWRQELVDILIYALDLRGN